MIRLALNTPRTRWWLLLLTPWLRPARWTCDQAPRGPRITAWSAGPVALWRMRYPWRRY